MAEFDAIRWLRLSDEDNARLRAAIASVMTAYPHVVAAYHYGSSARGASARDIDVAVVVDRAALRTIDVERIAQRLATECGRPLEDLDVRVVNEADPVFLGNLMREGKRCYERDLDARVAFEVQAMSTWLDFQPVWDRLRSRVLEVWSRG